MRTIPIPNTDLVPSALCLGTGDMGAGIDRNMAFQMLDAFLDQGGTFLDSAKVYSDWIPGETSRSEKLIGAWMKQRGNRSKVIVSTKGAHPDLKTMHIQRMSPAEIVSDLEASLRHLQVDCIDLYWLHRDDATRPVEEILDTLQSQVQAGKIRYFGGSNWTLDRIKAAQEYAAERGFPGFAAIQNLWNLGEVKFSAIGDPTLVVMDQVLWNYHRATDLAAIPYTSQANGLFQKLDAGGPEALPRRLREMYLSPVTEQRYLRLQTLREQTGLTTTQIVLGYLTSQPFPTLPVVGPHSLAQLADCLSAGDVKLSAAQVQYLQNG